MKKHQSKSFQSENIKKGIKFGLITIFFLYFVFVAVSAFKNGVNDINYSGIEVSSNVDSSIYIDNVKIGTAKPNESFIYAKIVPGEKRIKVVKDDDNSLFYEKDIIFEKGTKVSIDWVFGVTNETSSGTVKYFIAKSEDNNKIRIISLTPNTEISIDSAVNSKGIIDADNKEHTVEISKTGYLSKNLKLKLSNNINTSSDTGMLEKYNTYDLVVEIALFQLPFS